jgi:hypothetical protein
MRSSTTSLALAALTLGAAVTAPTQAAFVSASSTTTAMGSSDSNFDISHLSDGSCLTTPGSLTSTCQVDGSSGNQQYTWRSAAGNPNGSIDFGLGDLFSVSGMSIWNLNLSSSSNVAFSVQEIALSYSDDGSTFNPIAAFSVNGGAAGSTGTLTQVPNFNTSPSNPNLITFSAVTASSIRLQVSNSGSSLSGLSEVAFDAAEAPTPAPLPPTALLLTPALGWLGLRGVRRKPRRG